MLTSYVSSPYTLIDIANADHIAAENELELASRAGNVENALSTDFDLELGGAEQAALEVGDASEAAEEVEAALVEADAQAYAGRRRRHAPPPRAHRHHGPKHHHRHRHGPKHRHPHRRHGRRRRRRRRGLFRRLARAARRIARKLRRRRRRRRRSIIRRVGRVARKVARKMAKAAAKAKRKIARSSAMKSLAKQLRKAGRRSRRALLKNKRKLKKLAKKLKLSASKVKKIIKHPRRMLKKAKKLGKKAKKALKKKIKKNKKKAKKARRAAKRKYQPKGLRMKKTPLTKRLKKVVETEPAAAAIKVAKNNWAWEDNVIKRLDKYVPPDPRDIKHRIATFESEADDACNKAEVLCVQQNLDHPLNGKTCQKAQKACFHARVALRVITEASTVCVEAEAPCARKDWQSKGKCLTLKAKCKRLLNAADYQYDQIHKVGKKVRDMNFNDKEANLAIDNVNKQAVNVRKAQRDHDEAEPKAMKCSETIALARTCELDMDESPKCVKAKKDATLCKAVVKDFRKLQKNLKKQIKRIDFAISRRNAAQAEAKMGAAL